MKTPNIKRLEKLLGFFLFAILLLPNCLQAQEIEDVRFVERGDTLTVYFNLTGDENTWYDIEVQVMENINGQLRILRPTQGTISGDEKGVLPGQSKLIRWDFGKDPQFANTDDLFLNLIAKETNFINEQADVKVESNQETNRQNPTTTEEEDPPPTTPKQLSAKEKKQKAKYIAKRKIQQEKERRKKQKELTKLAEQNNDSTALANARLIALADTNALGEYISVRKPKKLLFAPKPIAKDSKVWNEIYPAKVMEAEKNFTLTDMVSEQKSKKRPPIMLKKKPENPFLMDARIALGLLPQDGELPKGIAPSMASIYIGDLLEANKDIQFNAQIDTTATRSMPLKGKAKRNANQIEKSQKASAKRQRKVDAINAKKQAKIDKKKARKEKERPFWDLFKPVKEEEVPASQDSYSKYNQWRNEQ